MFTITFNQSTSPCASKGTEENLMFIRYIEKFVNDLLERRGYIYVNQIYELLGVKWDPERDNLCCIKDKKRIEFNIRSVVDGGFELDIC